ncbi:hypothetical protein GQ457_06G017530 [Hibiscus cannabinus]
MELQSSIDVAHSQGSDVLAQVIHDGPLQVLMLRLEYFLMDLCKFRCFSSSNSLWTTANSDDSALVIPYGTLQGNTLRISVPGFFASARVIPYASSVPGSSTSVRVISYASSVPGSSALAKVIPYASSDQVSLLRRGKSLMYLLYQVLI